MSDRTMMTWQQLQTALAAVSTLSPVSSGLMIERAYLLARAPDLAVSLSTVLTAKEVDIVVLDLGFLGRLKAAFETILRVTQL